MTNASTRSHVMHPAFCRLLTTLSPASQRELELLDGAAGGAGLGSGNAGSRASQLPARASKSVKCMDSGAMAGRLDCGADAACLAAAPIACPRCQLGAASHPLPPPFPNALQACPTSTTWAAAHWARAPPA